MGYRMTTERTPARYWRRKAAKARAQAKRMNSPQARILMREVARKCELIASMTAKAPSREPLSA
jgi:hypothetical protein